MAAAQLNRQQQNRPRPESEADTATDLKSDIQHRLTPMVVYTEIAVFPSF